MFPGIVVECLLRPAMVAGVALSVPDQPCARDLPRARHRSLSDTARNAPRPEGRQRPCIEKVDRNPQFDVSARIHRRQPMQTTFPAFPTIPAVVEPCRKPSRSQPPEEAIACAASRLA